jgi:UDP-glucose 4-epimerase
LDNKPLRKDGDGQQTRDLIHVDDVVSANIFVAKTGTANKSVYNVGVGKAFSNNYILEKFAQKGYTNVEYAPARKGDVKHTLLDISKLKEFGWAPKVEFEVGLENVFNYWGL